MRPEDIPAVIKVLKEEYKRFKVPYVTEVASHQQRDPYMALVSCIISLRTKDSTTREASVRLFEKARTAGEMLRLSEKEIAGLIYPAGFYRVKAGTILDLSRRLVEAYSSKVPDTIDELVKLKGIGRKTANLVVTMGYGKPGICVDTHVHRITNRWGIVKTKTPVATEIALREAIDKRYWIELNDLLVAYGQNICTPVSPHCSVCRISALCSKVGVERQR